jgi:hypothetical protein
VRSLVIATAVVLTAPASAAAELRMTPGTVTPATIAFPNPAPLTYSLQLSAVGEDERFALVVAPPSFGPLAGGQALDFGAAAPRIDGPARLAGPAFGSSGALACAAYGVGAGMRGWDMLVPAGTTSTVSLGFVAAPNSPWPSTSYDLLFLARRRLSSGRFGTLPADQEVIVKGPATTGRRGRQIALDTTPPMTSRVRRGQRLAIRGTTDPPLANSYVSLWARTSRDFRFVRKLRTNGLGRFRGEVVARPGLAIKALSPAAPGIEVGRTCPLGFDVR